MNKLMYVLRCALLGLGVAALTTAGAATLADAIADLPQADQAKVAETARAFIRGKPAADRSANDLGWDCQAAAALARLGVEGARERLAGIGEALAALVVRSRRDGRAIGWPQAGEQKACVPAQPGANAAANCEGQVTIYAFQSGLGIACLADAGSLLGKPEWTSMASDAMAYWDRLRMLKAPCPDCIFFATSDSASDAQRYIRNMNLFIAFGAAELGGVTNNPGLLDVAKRAVRSDIWERDNGNRGYLGRLDPLWSSRAGEADRIENHSASMALLLTAMAQRLDDPKIAQHAQTVWRDWATCDEKRCKTAGCKYWAGDAAQCQGTATAAHCAFRMREKLAREQCEALITRDPSLGSYGLWAVTLATR